MSKKKREKKLLGRIKNRLQKRRQQQPVSPPDSPLSQFLNRPACADIQAPEGFRAVTAMHGIMEFGEPLRERLDAETPEALNAMMDLVMQVWNFTNPKIPQHPPREEIIDQLGEVLDLDEIDAIDLFDELVERKAWLFPDTMQPENPMTLFMRKEQEHVITQFDERQLDLAEAPIPPTPADQEMLDTLRQLDRALDEGKEYDEWEDLYFAAERQCCAQYFEWLTAKGVPEQQCEEFPFCAETYLNFIYRYNAGGLLEISAFEVEDFLMDHLLRKVITQPTDYVNWPPALRLLYRFLAEKGYCDDPHPFLTYFNDVEPKLIKVLQKRY